jgi:8-oxo-dGTP diphosphatase
MDLGSGTQTPRPDGLLGPVPYLSRQAAQREQESDGAIMFDALTSLPLDQRRHGQRYPVPGVVTIIRRISDTGRHYLLIKRKSDPYASMWAMIGGKWEFGETLEAAAMREVREETSLEASFVALRGFVNQRMIMANPDAKPGHYILFVCEVVAPDGKASEQNEGKVAWFTPDEIEALKEKRLIVPSDYAMMHRFAWSASQPYIEAEMVCADATCLDKTRLLRFEEIA